MDNAYADNLTYGASELAKEKQCICIPDRVASCFCNNVYSTICCRSICNKRISISKGSPSPEIIQWWGVFVHL